MTAFTILGVTITWLQLASAAPDAFKVCRYFAGPKACTPHTMTVAERNLWYIRVNGNY